MIAGEHSTAVGELGIAAEESGKAAVESGAAAEKSIGIDMTAHNLHFLLASALHKIISIIRNTHTHTRTCTRTHHIPFPGFGLTLLPARTR